ncbi:MAG TPA: hypothetical protein VG367_00090 [Mucilaginibacter sp.]|jgi:hypothetical protein|nr:hypothetical protein [Mucilaginibacter sp.]
MRKLKKEEYDLILFLIKDKPNSEHIIAELSDVFVEEMNDGGMGSLEFLNKERAGRKYGPTMAQIQLPDNDGIPLLISVDLDKDGDIFELDVWKCDFSKLIQFPLPPYNPL